MKSKSIETLVESLGNALLAFGLVGFAGAGLGGALWGAVSAFNIAVHWIPVDEWRPFVGAL